MSDPAILRFSTDDVPARDRAAMWREVHGRTMHLDTEPLSDCLSVKASLRLFTGLKVVTGRTSEVRYTRTRALIANDSDSDFRLSVNCSESATMVRQHGREVALGLGDATLFSCADVGEVTSSSPGSFLGIHIPYAALAPLASNVQDAIMRPIPRAAPVLRLLMGYMGLLKDEGAVGGPGLRQLAVAHVQDLVALAVGATRDAAFVAQGRGGRAARLHAVKSDIIGNLSRGDLTIGAVALRHHVSPRYVQMLFESEGATFSDFVRRQRLGRVHAMLNDFRCTDLTWGPLHYGVPRDRQ